MACISHNDRRIALTFVETRLDVFNHFVRAANAKETLVPETWWI